MGVGDEFQLLIKDRMIWNCKQFISIITKTGNHILDGTEMIPQRVPTNPNLIKLNGWEFDVHSTVHIGAESNDILEGMALLNKHAPTMFESLVEIFFLKSLNDYNTFTPSKPITRFSEKEPDMTEILRLSYWYYKCHQVDPHNFLKYKSGEVRQKLAQGILSNIFEYVTRVEYTRDAEETEQDFLSWFQGALRKSRPPKPADRKYSVYITKLTEALRNVTSELMLAGLCSYNGYELSFDTYSSLDHDYDFLVNNIPVQVKTPSPSDGLLSSIKNLEELVQSRPKHLDDIKKEITKFLSSLRGLRLMEQAIEQGARILLFNMSYIFIGQKIRKFIVENNVNTSYGSALQNSLDMVKRVNLGEQELPLIVFVFNCDYDYALDILFHNIPVRTENSILHLDRAKLQHYT
jgi:hypothetical protein